MSSAQTHAAETAKQSQQNKLVYVRKRIKAL